MPLPRRDVAIDAALVLAGLALHLLALVLLDRFPPSSGFPFLFEGTPVLACAGALIALALGEPRGVGAAATVQWMVVGFTLFAYPLGLAFVPAAVVLTLAVTRPGPLARTAPPATE